MTDGPIECPHCGEPTLPNRLADGSLVCSCAAERSLPPGSCNARLMAGAAGPPSDRQDRSINPC